MVDGDQSRLEGLVCWVAERVGFSSIEEDAIRTSVQRLAYVAAFAWLLTMLSAFFGLISPFAGMAVLSLVTAVMAGGVLLGARTNADLIASALELQDELPVAPAAAVPEFEDEDDEPALPQPVAVRPAFAAATERRLLSRGEIEGRAYAIYSDGSIEMDTAFGKRWFASIDLAHEFIGYRDGQSLPFSARPAAALLN